MACYSATVREELMPITAVMILALALWLGQTAEAADQDKTEQSKDNGGVTVEDLGRALKSAAQNIEKEIPKIGPAIGETFKKLTEKDSDRQTPQNSDKEKK